jgi:osmotically-inducible protein OsmY
MAREEWQDREEERRRAALRDRDFGQADRSDAFGYDDRGRDGYRGERDISPSVPPSVDDYGQADYSTDYAYDADRRAAYRRYEADRDYGRRMDGGDYRSAPQPRSWMDGARDFFTPAPRAPRVETRTSRPARRGPSDRVLWAVIVERLEDERGLDLRDLEVIVEDAEVTLNGTVRHKADKRRIEDVAEIDGVRHVQNNLRLRGHSHWTFL